MERIKLIQEEIKNIKNCLSEEEKKNPNISKRLDQLLVAASLLIRKTNNEVYKINKQILEAAR